jgi:diadenylate cyclase
LIHSSAYRPETIAIEMILIGVVVYAVLRFLHGTRGAHLLQGLVIILMLGFVVVRVLADQFGLERITVLYQPFVWTALLTTLIVFQPELRRGLMRIGETRFRRAHQGQIEDMAKAIAAACAQLSKNKIGALIAIEREIGLAGLAEQGVRLDAALTPELLNTIFWPGSALHDLGVIVQQGRISAAGCPFPLGDTDGMDRSLGSRHRAAIGLSLESDAGVVVVSEETGSISIAERGRLDRHIPPEALAGMLRRRLASTRGGELDPTRPSTGGSDDAEQEGLDLPPLSGSLPEERTRTRKPAETASV